MKQSEFTIELLEALAEYLEARNSMKQKDNKQNFCDDCGSSQVSYAKIH